MNARSYSLVDQESVSLTHAGRKPYRLSFPSGRNAPLALVAAEPGNTGPMCSPGSREALPVPIV